MTIVAIAPDGKVYVIDYGAKPETAEDLKAFGDSRDFLSCIVPVYGTNEILIYHKKDSVVYQERTSKPIVILSEEERRRKEDWAKETQ